MDSLPILVLISASVPAGGYLSALRHRFVVRSRLRCSTDGGAAVVGQKMAPSGADLAATNCLLALAVLRLTLDQPQADLASAVPIWLLLMHPLPVFWYWVEAIVGRYVKRRGDGNGVRRRRQFIFASKLLHVSITAGSLKTDSLDDVHPQTVERITVL